MCVNQTPNFIAVKPNLIAIKLFKTDECEKIVD